MDLPLALSIHKFVNSVGADAGFAAFICVAVIGLLYFAQARETATLRDRLQDAHDRIGGLEARIAQLMHLQSSRQSLPQAPVATRVTPPPAGARPAASSSIASVRRIPAATAVGVAGAPAAGALLALVPFAPFGVGAPALASATKLIPDPVLTRPTSATPAAPVAPGPAAPGAPAAPGLPGPAPVSAVRSSGEPVPVVAPAHDPAAPAVPVGAPAVAVAAAADLPDDTIVVQGAAVTAAANGRAQTPAPAPGGGPATRVASRTGGEPIPPRVQIGADGSSGAPRQRRTVSAPARPLGEARFDVFEQDRGGSRSRLRGRRLPLAIATLAAVVIIGGLVAITQNGSGTTSSTVHPSTGGTTTSKSPSGAHTGRTHKAAPFSSSSVTVAVLNGTGVNGLAADVATVLSGAGYRKGSVTNAASHTQATTTVYFMPGFKADAQHVAKQLKLSSSSVQAATQSAIQACSTTPGQAATSCSGDVIVSVGQDKASLASSAPSSAG